MAMFMRLLVVFVCLSIPIGAWAESIPKDSRVRVTHGPHKAIVVGTVVSRTEQSLLVRSQGKDGAAVSLRMSTVHRVERSLGVESNAAKGGKVGAGIGAGLGLLLIISAGSEGSDFLGSGILLGAAIVTTVVGAGLGALIGYTSKTEHWREVPVSRLEVSVNVGGDRQRVAVSFSF